MMGLFEGSLVIGLGGLVGMAGLQFTHHMGDSGTHLGDAGHAGHLGDAGHAAHLGDAGHGGHIGDGGHGSHVGDAGHAGHAGDGGHHAGHQADTGIHLPLWIIPSPIRVFSVLIGFGLAGMIFQQWFGFWWTVALAVANGLVFERCLVRPYWQFLFRFASSPARLLEGTVATKAIAVTSFNASGCGLVRLCIDGESRDVLARLVPSERGKVPVRKGDTVLIEGARSDDSVIVSRALTQPHTRRPIR